MADERSRLREFEEIVGYHLEQAFRYRVAVGSLDSRAASLAARASERLEAAGRRALARSDPPAGIGPLEPVTGDRKSTRLNSSHAHISYAVFCLKKKDLYFS